MVLVLGVLVRMELKVSDHAIVRYLERVCDLDLSYIKQHILDQVDPEKVEGLARKEQLRLKLNDKREMIVRGKTVVTIL